MDSGFRVMDLGFRAWGCRKLGVSLGYGFGYRGLRNIAYIGLRLSKGS